jgi:hypothetical protein
MKDNRYKSKDIEAEFDGCFKPLVFMCALALGICLWLFGILWNAQPNTAKYDTPKPQDTTINLGVSTGAAQLEEPKDTVQDVYFVDDWEDQAVIK